MNQPDTIQALKLAALRLRRQHEIYPWPETQPPSPWLVAAEWLELAVRRGEQLLARAVEA